MCDLQILIVVRDQLFDRLTTYSSGKLSDGKGIFSADEAFELIKTKREEKKTVKQFTDDDYQALDTSDSTKKTIEQCSLPKRKRGRPKKDSCEKAINKKK